MKIIECVQGSEEWHRAKLGIPSASNFARIFTAGGKPSAQANTYMNQLLGEHFLGEPAHADGSKFMQRGTAIEDAARKWYAYDRGVAIRQVGVCLRDDGMVAASPDGLISEDELLELKVPAASTQIAYLFDSGELMSAYWTQCQGQLYVTGRSRVALCSYNPSLPPVVVQIDRDDGYIEKLDAAVSLFVETLLHARAKLERLGCRPAKLKVTPEMMEPDATPF